MKKEVILDDRTTWPPIGSVWEHTNGNVYAVIDFTNTQPERQDKYPTRISYQNVANGEKYSRNLVDWDRSMIYVGEVRPEDKRDPIIEEVRADLLRRSQLGIKKYGTTLADDVVSSLDQKLNHAYEEALDLANYLKWAITELRAKKTHDTKPD